MSNIKELIRAEIERLKSKYRHNGLWTSSFQSDLAMAKIESMNELLSFLDTLPDESEQPTRGYDEAYLNEKIAKASKSWEGVDVDKFMDEIRGREPMTDCHELEEAARAFVGFDMDRDELYEYETGVAAFKAGSEWQKAKMISALKNDGDLPIQFIDKFHEIDRTAFQTRQEEYEGADDGRGGGRRGLRTSLRPSQYPFC